MVYFCKICQCSCFHFDLILKLDDYTYFISKVCSAHGQRGATARSHVALVRNPEKENASKVVVKMIQIVKNAQELLVQVGGLRFSACLYVHYQTYQTTQNMDSSYRMFSYFVFIFRMFVPMFSYFVFCFANVKNLNKNFDGFLCPHCVVILWEFCC